MVALAKPADLDPPPDDGLPVREIAPHSLEKIHYWCRYAEAAATATKSAFSGARVCIDLYSAFGVCADRKTRQRTWGSALLSLQVTNPFDVYVFNDINPEATATLAARAEAVGVAGASVFRLDLRAADAVAHARDIRDAIVPFGPKVIVTTGDANTAPALIKELLPQTRRYVLSLVDPQSASFHWSAFEALAFGERAFDVLVLFADEFDLARNFSYYLANPRAGKKLDDFFGTGAWREIVRRNPQHAEHDLQRFYEERMQSLLGLRLGHAKSVAMKRRTLYHLVFGSRGELGISLWNDANKRTPWQQDELPLF